MLTSGITTTITHPTEPGVTFTIRKLAHYAVMMARDKRIDSLARTMRALEGITMPQPDPDAPAPPVGSDLDRMTVLTHGIDAWSYPVPVDAGVADLDEYTASWLFDQIVEFSYRPADAVKTSAVDSAPPMGQGGVDGQQN